MELTERQKVDYVTRILNAPNNGLSIVASLVPRDEQLANPMEVLNLFHSLQDDPFVIEEMERQKRKPIDRLEFCRKLMTVAEHPGTLRKDYASIMKIVADVLYLRTTEISSNDNFEKQRELANMVVPGIAD